VFGDWGLGIGDWGLGPIPNPQSPIYNLYNLNSIYLFNLTILLSFIINIKVLISMLVFLILILEGKLYSYT